jgi:hypothetical protein
MSSLHLLKMRSEEITWLLKRRSFGALSSLTTLNLVGSASEKIAQSENAIEASLASDYNISASSLPSKSRVIRAFNLVSHETKKIPPPPPQE